MKEENVKEERMKKIREQIDRVDDGIINLLQRRVKLARQLRGCKPQVVDEQREQEVMVHWESFAEIARAVILTCRDAQCE